MILKTYSGRNLRGNPLLKLVSYRAFAQHFAIAPEEIKHQKQLVKALLPMAASAC